MMKLNKSIELSDAARDRANERRRDNRALKNAGVKKYNPTTAIPIWFKSIYKTWGRNYTSDIEAWNSWCNERIDHLGIDPRKKKNKLGRPPLPDHLRKTPTVKTNRNAKMEQLLLDNNIHIVRTSKYGVVYLKEYPTIELMVNGRIQLEDGSRISVHQFLNKLNLE